MKSAVILYNRSAMPERLDEQDTLTQAYFVETQLKSLGFKTDIIGCDANLAALAENLFSIEPDIVFNGVETFHDSAQLIHVVPSFVEALGYRTTGAGSQAIYLTSDKLLTKKLLRSHALPTADWVTLNDPDLASGNRPTRWIMKSVWEDASFGIDEDSVISAECDHQTLRDKLLSKKKRYGGDFFAETYLSGREFNVSLLELNGTVKVLPIAEMVYTGFDDRPKILTYNAKWKDQTFEFQNTTRSFDFSDEDQPLLQQLEQLSLQCWDLFQLNGGGYARVDFRVDNHSTPHVLEINANPAVNPDSGFMAASSRFGLSSKETIGAIVEAAYKKRP